MKTLLNSDQQFIEQEIAQIIGGKLSVEQQEEYLRTVFSCIDNTTLSGDDTQNRVRELCRSSIEMRLPGSERNTVASVCVYPVFVGLAKKELRNSGIKVASVAGAFPAGQSPIEVKLQEVKYALDEGADEIDMVLSRGSFLEGDYQKVQDEVSAIKELCGKRTLKVILETGELSTIENIYKASMLSMEAGADFIKTSTGKISVSATEMAAFVMLTAIRNFEEKTHKIIGFKAAGGISTPEQALNYYLLAENVLGKKHTENQFFRIGASRLTNRLFSFLTK